jgi:hypothetical protein
MLFHQALNIASAPFCHGTARQKIEAAQEKQLLDPKDYVCSDDIDKSLAAACDHAVVIANSSMGGKSLRHTGSELVIKDSALLKSWAVDNVEVLVFPGAEV